MGMMRGSAWERRRGACASTADGDVCADDRQRADAGMCECARPRRATPCAAPRHAAPHATRAAPCGAARRTCSACALCAQPSACASRAVGAKRARLAQAPHGRALAPAAAACCAGGRWAGRTGVRARAHEAGAGRRCRATRPELAPLCDAAQARARSRLVRRACRSTGTHNPTRRVTQARRLRAHRPGTRPRPIARCWRLSFEPLPSLLSRTAAAAAASLSRGCCSRRCALGGRAVPNATRCPRRLVRPP